MAESSVWDDGWILSFTLERLLVDARFSFREPRRNAYWDVNSIIIYSLARFVDFFQHPWHLSAPRSVRICEKLYYSSMKHNDIFPVFQPETLLLPLQPFLEFPKSFEHERFAVSAILGGLSIVPIPEGCLLVPPAGVVRHICFSWTVKLSNPAKCSIAP